MTTPTDTLRAIVEGKYEFVTTECSIIGIGIPPAPTERILAQTLLAVLEYCDKADNGDTFEQDIESIITTKLKEAKE
jgi:hypothetical protein